MRIITPIPKNPAYGRHKISWGVWIVFPTKKNVLMLLSAHAERFSVPLCEIFQPVSVTIGLGLEQRRGLISG